MWRRYKEASSHLFVHSNSPSTFVHNRTKTNLPSRPPHQNTLYALASATVSAGAISASSPLARTSKDSGSTVTRGVASFHFMSPLRTRRQPRTASTRLDNPYWAITPELMDTFETKLTEFRAAEAGCAPHIGRP